MKIGTSDPRIGVRWSSLWGKPGMLRITIDFPNESAYQNRIWEMLKTIGVCLDPAPPVPEGFEGPDALRIEELDLKNKSYNTLRKAHIWYAGSLCRMTQYELRNLPGAGPALIADVQERLAVHGLQLKQPERKW